MNSEDTTVHDPDALDDIERRNANARAWIGAGIGCLFLIALMWYLLEPPAAGGGAVLGVAVVAGVAEVSWLLRCGDGHEHRRLRAQNRELIAAQARFQASLDEAVTAHRDQMAAFASAVDQRLGEMGAKIDARHRDRAIGSARIALAEMVAAAVPDENSGGQQQRFAVDSSTPAGGLRLAWDSSMNPKEN